MRKKSLLIFGLLSLLALGTVGVAVSPISEMSDILAEEGNVANYTQTFTHLDEKDGKLGLTTKNGNFIKVAAPGKSANGLVELNCEEEFTLLDPIGGIISMEIDFSIDGVNFPIEEGQSNPLDLMFGYLVDIAHPEKGAVWQDNYKSWGAKFSWGLNQAYETPSLISLGSYEDKVLIKSLTLTYNCIHLEADDIIDQTNTYLIFDEQQYPGVCAAGQPGYRQGDQLAFAFYFEPGMTFYFKKPHQEKLAINLASDGEPAANAIENGLVSYDSETRVFTILQQCELGIYIKDSGVTYVTFNKYSIKDWYVTGENITLDGQLVANSWGQTPASAKFTKVNATTFEFKPFIAQAGENATVIKFLSSDGIWLGHEIIEHGKNIVEPVGQGNIKFKSAGTFKLTIYFDTQGTRLYINPYNG